MGKERGDHELEVFRRFAVAAGLHSTRDCGEKRISPEPDVLFHSGDGKPTAFELVELLDQDYAGRIGLLVATKTALRTYYEALAPAKRETFDRKYGNALLYFRFHASLTFKRRRAAFEAIFEELLALPNDFTGDAFEHESALSQVLEGVSISRGRFVGPIFDPESVGWIGDPQFQRCARSSRNPTQRRTPSNCSRTSKQTRCSPTRFGSPISRNSFPRRLDRYRSGAYGFFTSGEMKSSFGMNEHVAAGGFTAISMQTDVLGYGCIHL